MTESVPSRGADLDYDYVSEDFYYPALDEHFPNRVPGCKSDNPWVYLRSWVPHKWYVDQRNPIMGFVSSDEAAILHTLAGIIPDARALEIGSHRGWSTAHIATAVATLDVVEPAFEDQARMEDVAESLKRCGVLEKCSLYPGFSPDKVVEIDRARQNALWNFAFIDGDHEKDAVRADAAVVAARMARDAIVVFHDLASPDVANGLAYMRSLGWKTRVFQTMQILGVAWRGNVVIPEHIPDPKVHWTLPPHLRSFAVSGETEAARNRRFDRLFADLTSYDRHAREAAPLLPGAIGPIDKFVFGFRERGSG